MHQLLQKIISYSLVFLIIGPLAAQREEQDFNANWKFQLSDTIERVNGS